MGYSKLGTKANFRFSLFSISNREQVQYFFRRCITTQRANTSCKTFNLSIDTAPDINKELNLHEPPISLEPSQFYGSMRRAKNEGDTNCWSSPDGTGFMIRGKTYLKDNTKVGSKTYKYITPSKVEFFLPFLLINGIANRNWAFSSNLVVHSG